MNKLALLKAAKTVATSKPHLTNEVCIVVACLCYSMDDVLGIIEICDAICETDEESTLAVMACTNVESTSIGQQVYRWIVWEYKKEL